MITEIVNNQREFFLTNATKPLEFRLNILRELRKTLIRYKSEIFAAFMADYNKCEFDVLATEFTLVLGEIDYMLKHLKKLAKPQKVRTNIFNFPAKSFIISEPFGVTLIMSPWNYPLNLSLCPLVGALACGNTVVLKPSSYAENVALVMKKMLDNFQPELISVVLGGRRENALLLEEKFDYIFFTGGEEVGKLVMEKASKHLTPVSLELGGKSPCIVDESSDIDLAARRITWGKFLNAGQTCVAPDYIYVHESIKPQFIEKVKAYIQKFYYSSGALSPDFPHIINDKHVQRAQSLIAPDKLIIGGKIIGRCLEPTVLNNVTWEDAVMKEEIFAPIMPVLSFSNLDELLSLLKRKPKPLALYIFSRNKSSIAKTLSHISFGGGAINDTVMHLTNDNMPFGGVGSSGMGGYHGKYSFDTFSHKKSILKKGKLELNTKYPPYNDKKQKMLEFIAKSKK